MLFNFAGNETAANMVTSGMLVSLIFYLYTEMHISFPNTSNLMTNVIGTSGVTPLLGAFLADAYLGRYFTIGIFSTIYFVVRLPYSLHTHTHTCMLSLSLN